MPYSCVVIYRLGSLIIDKKGYVKDNNALSPGNKNLKKQLSDML